MKHSLSVISVLLSTTAFSFTLTGNNSNQSGWAQSPLQFRVNRTNCPATLDTYLNRAFAIWNSAPETRLKLSLGADTTQTIAELDAGTATDVPMVACDPNFSATFGVDGNSIPGVGFVRGTSVNPIVNGGLVLNVESATNGDINQLSEIFVDVVVAHEIGHVLGFGHSNDVNSLMYYDASAKQTLSLSQDDLDAVSFLYPRDELKNFDLIGGCGTLLAASDDDNKKGPGSHFFGGNSLGLFLSLYLLLIVLLKSRRNFERFSSPKTRFV